MVDVATGWTECLPLTRDGSLVVEAMGMTSGYTFLTIRMRKARIGDSQMNSNDVLVEDALSGVNPRSMSKRDKVAAFLETALANGPAKVSELERAARAAGLLGERQRVGQAKVFRNAKETLRIDSDHAGFGRGGEWMWKLPSPTTTAGLDSQSSPVIQTETMAPTDGLPANFTGLDVVPLRLRKGVAHLLSQPCPREVRRHQWRQLLEDCHRFIVAPEFGAQQAARLGWEEISLFGCTPVNPFGYLDRAGLLWLVAGGRIVRLWAEGAEIQSASGECRPYRRRHAGRSVVGLPWQLWQNPEILPSETSAA
jgi:hypothetical protein